MEESHPVVEKEEVPTESYEKIEPKGYAPMMETLYEKYPEKMTPLAKVEMIDAGSSTLFTQSRSRQFPLPVFSFDEKEYNKVFLDAMWRNMTGKERDTTSFEKKAPLPEDLTRPHQITDEERLQVAPWTKSSSEENLVTK